MRAARIRTNAVPDPLAPVRPFVENSLSDPGDVWLAGVVGTHPSAYSKSPHLWSAAISALGIPVAYLPLDVPSTRIDDFFIASRAAPRLLGFNVTVPYKERVIPYLDDIDAEARRIGAVNTVVRTRDGRLLGANTDGLGVGAALIPRLNTRTPSGKPSILVLGGGGSARAAAVGLGHAFPGADILICNRTDGRAQHVASAANAAGARGHVLSDEDLDRRLPEVDVLVNATSVGMAGVIEVSGGVTWLEPFSALAPAPAPVLHERSPGGPTSGSRKPPRQWTKTAWTMIAANLEISLRRAVSLAPQAFVLDLVYAPLETVLLKHVRWTGHECMNGMPVLVAQAVEAFVRVGAPLLEGRDPHEVRRLVESTMRGAVEGGV